MHRFVRWFVPLVGIAFSGLTALSLLGGLAWQLDVVTHFTLQLTAGLILCLAFGLAARIGRIPLVTMAAALAVNLWLVGGYFLPSVQAAGDQSPALRIVTLNVYTENTDYASISAFLRREQPDIVLVTEAEPPFVHHVEATLADLYPYVYDESVRGTLGFTLLSREPLLDARTVYMEHGRRRRFVTAQIAWAGRIVTVWGVHPLPALGTRWANSRNTELATLEDLVQEVEMPLVILGDFNASPWSAPMRRWLNSSNLTVAARGHGIAPTWYLAGPLLSAPLDYILTSPHWQTADYRLGPDINSDHRPVIADLRFKDVGDD